MATSAPEGSQLWHWEVHTPGGEVFMHSGIEFRSKPECIADATLYGYKAGDSDSELIA